jgi:hypothetical protein
MSLPARGLALRVVKWSDDHVRPIVTQYQLQAANRAAVGASRLRVGVACGRQLQANWRATRGATPRHGAQIIGCSVLKGQV